MSDFYGGRIMTLLRFSLILFFVSFLGCSSITVNAEWDETADMSAYKTFSWVPEPPEKTGDARFDNPILHDRIQKNILRTLSEQGYQGIDTGKPDFYVGHHLSLKTKVDVQTMQTYYPYSWYYPYRSMPTQVREYEQGMLIIDIIDAKTEKVVWRGWATKRLKENPSNEESQKTVKKIVGEILAQFPPK
jgi:hypothetical protein